MHEKTLLYSALACTAIGAVFGVYKAKRGAEIAITPVAVIDSSKSLTAAEVPIRLTSSDGTGLKLVSLKAEAAIEDPLALTEMHLEFENPEDRVLEGTFRITLPQGASLSRFAMKVNGAWQEGEVVEKQAARRAYEDFLHRKQDPALLEQGAGNEFSARVFPIPARGRKEIVVTYAEVIESSAPYTLPLKGLPQLGELDVNVHASGKQAASGKTNALFGIHQKSFTPAADFSVPAKELPRSPGLRHGDLAIARVVPFAESKPEPVSSAVILVDTSASRGLGLSEQASLLRSVVAKIPGDATLTVACFDQEIATVYEGKASGFGEAQTKAIIARGALGASNFEAALAWAGTQASKTKADRLILLTDGVATAGETDAQKLRTKVEALRPLGVQRIDAIAMGGIRDDGFLRTVVRGVLDRDGTVLDTKIGAEAIAKRLSEATTSGVPVKVEGAKWAWPEKLDGLQAGDEVLVYAEVDEGKPFRVSIGKQDVAPDLRTIDRPLVERAWAQAKIQSLVEAPKEGEAATKQAIIALSTKHRVLSPHTALLVLETDNDYRRFNIDRNAKLDILSVKDGRVAVTQSPRSWEEKLAEARKNGDKDSDDESDGTGTRAKGEEGSMGEPPPPTAAAADPAAAAPGAFEARGNMWGDEIGDSFGAGGLGLSGVGEGGGGRGEGADLGNVGTIGQGAGTGTGQGFGSGAGRLGAGHAAPSRAPRGGSAAEPLDEAPRPRPAPPPAAERRVAGPNATVRAGSLEIENGMSSGEAQRVLRGSIPRIRQCYQTALSSDPTLHGSLKVRFVVDSLGEVKTAEIAEGPSSAGLRACVQSAMKQLRFPAPGTGDARFTQSFDLVSDGAGTDNSDTARNDNLPEPPKALPYEGRLKIVMEALAKGEKDKALEEANKWHADQPGDILSLVALGEVLEARGDVSTAARAYGSILELFSFRAASRRFAGERLERLSSPVALDLAIDTYAKAVEQRPDHPASHRLHAFALVKKGDYEKAFEAMKKGATRSYPAGRFAGVDRILKEDMGLIAAAWARAEPAKAAEIKTKLREARGTEENGPSLRFVLNWETDANDVDFHIRDGKGGHAYYSEKVLQSGGELYADVTTGYGPECFTIRKARADRAYPYTLQAHYYSRGPMGYGMGKLQVIEHDGNGKLTFEERPFVVMIDRAYVDMGKVSKETLSAMK